MVKDEFSPEPMKEVACEQRGAIDSALRRLGLRPDREGFSRLGEDVGVKGATLYKAWLGNIKVSGPVLVALSKVGSIAHGAAYSPGEEAPRKLGEEIGFILRNESNDQVNLLKAFVESVHRQVADNRSHQRAA